MSGRRREPDCGRRQQAAGRLRGQDWHKDRDLKSARWANRWHSAGNSNRPYLRRAGALALFWN